MPIRLVLADKHPLMLEALENLFQREGDLQVVAKCANSDEVAGVVHRHRPDVLIMDVCMAGNKGLAIFPILKDKHTTRVVLFASEIEEKQLLDAVRSGVAGIVLKELDPRLLVQCVRKVHAGEQWMERHSIRNALQKVLRWEAHTVEMARKLTLREIELVRMIAHGLTNKAIAEKLFISISTVKTHLHNIYRKLGLNGRLALMRYAQEKGLI